MRVDKVHDTGGAGAADGLWLSQTALAKVKGVSKVAISKRMGRLEAEGLIEVRRRGNEKLVRLAEWDNATNQATDPARLVARTTAALTGGTSPPADDEAARRDPTYVRELTRKAGFEADRREIEVRRLKGELLEADDVRRAMERLAAAIVRDLEAIPTFAEDLCAAVALGGVTAARNALKAKMREIRATMARSMQSLAEADRAVTEGQDEDDEEAAT